MLSRMEEVLHGCFILIYTSMLLGQPDVSDSVLCLTAALSYFAV